MSTATIEADQSTKTEPKKGQANLLWCNDVQGHQVNIPIIGITGENWSGKTIFGITIDPTRTVVIDLEQSSATYQSAGFLYVDMYAAMREKYPSGNFTDSQLWEEVQAKLVWASTQVNDKGESYRVAFVDPFSDVQAGVYEYITKNPTKFGLTAGQIQKMSGVVWGCVNREIKKLCLKCNFETFVFANHMGAEFKAGEATGKRKAKGVNAFYESCHLYLQLERTPDKNGKRPEKPSAVVLKDRLAWFDKGIPKPFLPQRIPVCTPDTIRGYLRSPANWNKPKKGETVEVHEMTEEERMNYEVHKIELAKEASEAESKKIENEAKLIEMKRRYGLDGFHETKESEPAQTVESVDSTEQTTTDVRVEKSTSSVNGSRTEQASVSSPGASGVSSSNGSPGAATGMTEDKKRVLIDLKNAKDRLGINTDEQWLQILGNYKVKTALDLTLEQMTDLADRMLEKLREKEQQSMKTDLDRWAEGAVPEAGSPEK